MNPRFFRNGIVMLALVVVALAVVFTVVSQSTPATGTGYSQFLSEVQGGKVSKVVQEGSKLSVTSTG
ncbi:MAG TPA: ATP-dependent metallopeptidase FtsH/Yme1/Tma family protein, partial [Candidatus Limnocylindrales bacterium]